MTAISSRSRAGRILTLVAVLTMAFNLRTAAASLGTVLSFVRDDLSISATEAGFLVTLPVLCFAVFGTTTVMAARRLGLHRTVLLAMVLVAAGSILRAEFDSQAFFWLGTAAALTGAAVGNVLLPPLVKLHFPAHVAQISVLFVAATMGGAAASAAFSLTLMAWLGSWQSALLVWGICAAVCVGPWLVLARADTRFVVAPAGTYIRFIHVVRSRLAWAMVVFFGLQSTHAYVAMGWLPTIMLDAGNDKATVGLVVGVAAFLGIPISLFLPRLMRVVGQTSLLPVAFATFTALGWLGIMLAPTTVPWVWGAFLGLGTGAFPWLISLIPLRADTVDGTAALSGFVQTFGYLLAAIGPAGMGILYDLFGSWSPPLLVLALGCMPLAIVGHYLVRPMRFEATLPFPSR